MPGKKQLKAAKKAADVSSPPPKQDKSYLKTCFTSPTGPEIQLMLTIGNIPIEKSNIEPIAEGLLERLEEVKQGNWDRIELTLHAQICSLNALSTHFMAKALGGYSSPEVLKTLPQLPLEFANLSLKCQTEMRRCIELLHDLKNPKKPSQFIKTYVNQQLNQIQTEQQELRERLKATIYAPMDRSSTPEAKRDDPEVETVAEFHGTANGRGQAK